MWLKQTSSLFTYTHLHSMSHTLPQIDWNGQNGDLNACLVDRQFFQVLDELERGQKATWHLSLDNNIAQHKAEWDPVWIVVSVPQYVP